MFYGRYYLVLVLGAIVIFMNECTAFLKLKDLSTLHTMPNFRKRGNSAAFTSIPSYSFDSKFASFRSAPHSRRKVCPLRPWSIPLAQRILSQPTIYVVQDENPPKPPIQIAIPRADKPPYAMNTQQLVYVWLCR